MSVVPAKKVLLIVASEDYQPIEYLVSKNYLEAHNIKVFTASDRPGGAIAIDKSTTPVDLTLQNVVAQDFDGIFFIGGPGAMEFLDNSISYAILNEVKKLGKPYGAICIATRILAKANVLNGKKATGWNSDNALPIIFKANGVTFVDKPIMTDGLVVTAKGPKAAEEFAQGIIRVLTKKEYRENEEPAENDS